MNKILVILFLVLFSFVVYADCIAPVPGCVGQAQCACLIYFETFDSEGTQTANFNAGDTIYVDFTVENVGTEPLENMKFFYIIVIHFMLVA